MSGQPVLVSTPAALEPVTEAPVVVMMTEDEARDRVDLINSQVRGIGALLLDLKEREGWKALNYNSWTECLNKEFDESRRHLYRLMNAEEVRRDLGPIGHSVPESQLREFVDVPSEQRVEVYKEAKATALEGKVTAKHIRAVKKRRARPPVVREAVHGDTLEDRYDRFWYNLCRDLLYYPAVSEKDGLFAYMIDVCTKARQVLHETNDPAAIYQRTSPNHRKIIAAVLRSASTDPAPESGTLSTMT